MPPSDEIPPPPAPPAPVENGLARAGLVLGVLALFTLVLTGVPAIVCSALALRRPGGRGTASAGLVLGALGTLAGVTAGIWVYADLRPRLQVAKLRAADERNLQQIGDGFQAGQKALGGVSQYARGETGQVRPGLSFRVELLPFVGEAPLRQRFDAQLPWNAGGNEAASNTPVRGYTTPFDGDEPSVSTPYRVFVGGGALFDESGAPTSLLNVPDGTANTIMAIHAAEQVPWAEPRELKYDPNGPLPALGHPKQKGGFQVLMADGSARTISEKVSERTLRLLITKADGEPILRDW